MQILSIFLWTGCRVPTTQTTASKCQIHTLHKSRGILQVQDHTDYIPTRREHQTRWVLRRAGCRRQSALSRHLASCLRSEQTATLDVHCSPVYHCHCLRSLAIQCQAVRHCYCPKKTEGRLYIHINIYQTMTKEAHSLYRKSKLLNEECCKIVTSKWMQ